MSRLEKRFPLGTTRAANRNEANILLETGLSKVGDFNDGDVFVCGWPKSGNTWCQRLMAGICYGVETLNLTDQLAQVLCPDVHFREYYQRIAPAMPWKSHSCPTPAYRRVVHLIRDGRDALVSYWYMRRRVEPDLTLEQMFQSNNDLWPCSWEQHCLQWLSNPYAADILRIRYEDLLATPVSVLRQISEFVGCSKSDEQLRAISDGASFTNMQQVAERSGWAHPDTVLTRNAVRRGEAGSWRDEMPTSLARRYWERAGSMLTELGYPEH